MNVKDRFLSKVEKTNSCWIWKGYIHHKGYGRFFYQGKVRTAHRVSYWIFRQFVPGIYEVCHTCDVRHCVNPDHLFIGTKSDNMKDCAIKGRGNFQLDPPNKKKTHCPKGHEYTPENVWENKQGWRWCKECNRQKASKHYYDRIKRSASTKAKAIPKID